jgi:serine/threonine-protein kinase RsbW
MVENSETLTLPAALEFLSPATEFVRRGAHLAGLTGERLGAVDLVVEELFMNVSRYAYPPGVKGKIEIKWAIPKPGLLCIEISDEGTAFDPLSRGNPSLSEVLEERPIGGLGVFLIQQMTNSFRYRRDDDWNRVHLEISASSDD